MAEPTRALARRLRSHNKHKHEQKSGRAVTQHGVLWIQLVVGGAEREVDGVDALLLELRHCQRKASKRQSTAITTPPTVGRSQTREKDNKKIKVR